MKDRMKTVCAVSVAALLAVSPFTSSTAQAWGRGGHGWWPFAVGAVFGGVVASAFAQPRPVYQQPVVIAQPVYVQPPVVVVPARPVYGYGPPPPPVYYRY